MYSHIRKINKLRRKRISRKNPVSIQQTPEVHYIQGKTDGQDDLIAAIADNSIVLICGPAGSGKSYISTAMACQYLAQGKVEKIIISRPIVATSSKVLGALPGDLREKFDPYLIPVVEQMKKYYSHSEVEKFMRDKVIESVPLELMRGRTFDKSFIILDEAQNCYYEQLVMILTRIGEDSKLVINGDVNQSDLKSDSGAFERMLDTLEGIKDIEIVELLEEDIVRNKLIKDILRAVATRKV